MRKIIEVICKIKYSKFYNKKIIFYSEYSEEECFCEIKVNGEKKDIKKVMFNGSELRNSEAMIQTINSYLRNSDEFEYIYVDEKVGKIKEELQEMKNNVLIKFPQLWIYSFDLSNIDMYTLDLKTDYFSFYSSEKLFLKTEELNLMFNDDTSYLMLDNTGAIITGNEEFYLSAITDEIKTIKSGKSRYLYIRNESRRVFFGMSLKNFLNFFDFDYRKFIYEEDENGDGEEGFRLLDNTGTNLGGIESEIFYSIESIVDRLNIYYHDYIFRSISDASVAKNPKNLYQGEECYPDILDWLYSNQEYAAYIPYVECIVNPDILTD